MISRTLDIDPLEQTITRQIRARHWRGDTLLAEEEHTLQSQEYLRNELLMMLEQAGFGQIEIQGDFVEAQGTADSEVLVFIALKDRR